MIAIIDYGMGNLRSVAKAFEAIGAEVKVLECPGDIYRADKLVLPGVGAFKDAMRELRLRGLIRPIRDFVKRGKPFLGLCLGLQLIFSNSEEGGRTEGFDLLGGNVIKFSSMPLTLKDNSGPLKIPHMGWNRICIGGQRRADSGQKKNPNTERYTLNAEKACPLLKGIPNNSYMYFVHSYYADPDKDSCVAAWTDYGVDFPAVIWDGNIYATQFHPEKSQKLGLKILKNFARL